MKEIREVDLLLPLELDVTLENNGIITANILKGGYSEDENTVAAGKALIAAAINNKGIASSKNDSFSELGYKINRIDNSKLY